nr:BrnA antitoxin family protein [Variovorax boronicumulans]
MTASKRASAPSLGSDLKRVDRHVIQPAEYDELPELTDEMFARGVVNKGGRPRTANPKRLISIRLTEDVIQRWRATGPGWQTRMAEKLSNFAPK